MTVLARDPYAEFIRGRIRLLGTQPKPGSNTQPGVPYQPVAFEEFTDVACKDRAESVRLYAACLKEIEAQFGHPRLILDIGANIGFFTLRLAEKFKPTRCVAIEQDRASAEVLKHLAEWRGLNVKIHHHLIYMQAYSHWDVVLFLNVHQWLMRSLGPEATHRLLKLLYLRSGLLLFQTAHAESYARDIVTQEDARVSSLPNESSIHRYLETAGFNSPRTIMTSYQEPRFLISARGARYI